MNATRILPVAVIVLLIFPSRMLAQTAPPIEPGDRVRLIELDTGLRPFFGTVVDLAHDTLVLQAEGHQRPMSFALASLERVDVERGERRNTWRGAAWGTALGGIAGGALALTSFGEDCGSSEHVSETCAASGAAVFGAGFLIGALVGACVGALIGSSHPSPIWINVPLDVLVGETPTVPSGFPISASLRL